MSVRQDEMDRVIGHEVLEDNAGAVTVMFKFGVSWLHLSIVTSAKSFIKWSGWPDSSYTVQSWSDVMPGPSALYTYLCRNTHLAHADPRLGRFMQCKLVCLD